MSEVMGEISYTGESRKTDKIQYVPFKTHEIIETIVITTLLGNVSRHLNLTKTNPVLLKECHVLIHVHILCKYLTVCHCPS